jgi:hypothetical protein
MVLLGGVIGSLYGFHDVEVRAELEIGPLQHHISISYYLIGLAPYLQAGRLAAWLGDGGQAWPAQNLTASMPTFPQALACHTLRGNLHHAMDNCLLNSRRVAQILVSLLRDEICLVRK